MASLPRGIVIEEATPELELNGEPVVNVLPEEIVLLRNLETWWELVPSQGARQSASVQGMAEPC